MAQIRVRVRSTGQTGTVDQSEFDPNLFEPISAPSLNQQAGGGNLLTNLGAGTMNLLSGIFQAPARLGRGLGSGIESMVESRRVADDLATDRVIQEALQNRMSRTIDPEQRNLIGRQQQRIAQRAVGPQVDVGRRAVTASDDILKGGVGTVALAVNPASTRGSNILSGMLSGAGSGFGVSETGKELESATGGALFGGAIAGTGNLAGKLYSKLQSRSSKKLPAIKAKKLKDNPSFVTNRDELRKTAKNIGIEEKMTATQKMNIIESQSQQARQQINDLVSNSGPINQDKLIDRFASYLQESNFNSASKSYNDKLNIILGKLAQAGDDPVALNSVKSELRGILDRVFSRGNKPGQMEEVANAAFRAVQDTLDDVSPRIRELNSFQNKLYSLSQEYVDVIKKDKGAQFKLPIGSNVPLLFSQEQGRSMLQRALSGAGTAITSPLAGINAAADQPTLMNLLTAQAVSRANTPTETPLPTSPQVNLSGIFDQQSPAPTANDPGSILRQILTPENLTMAVLSGEISGAEAKQLQDLMGTMGGTGLDPEAGAQIKVIEDNLNELEQQLVNIPGGFAGGFLSLASNVPGLAPDAKVFNATRQAFTGPIARVISQEVGVLTDRDVKRAQDILPAASDTLEERQAKIAVLRRAINNLKSGKALSPEGQAFLQNSNSTDSEDVNLLQMF